MFINVYASQNPAKREDLWYFISAIMGSWNGGIVIFGDFNEVRDESERRGSQIDESASKKFNCFIANNNLIDVKIGGSKFTWIKGGGSKLSKLDRFLINENFEAHWPNVEAISDIRLHSDHKPIILRQVNRNYGNIPFKLYNSWMEEEGFDEMVRKAWTECRMVGTHKKIFILMQKLKAVKGGIKDWKKDRDRKTQEEKRKWIDRVEAIDKTIEAGGGSPNLLQERLDTLSKIRDKEKKENEDVMQKYKNKWCLEGDENTSLYHRNINKKKHIRSIKGIEHYGIWEVEPSKVKDIFKDHFMKIFQEDLNCNRSQDLGNTPRLSVRERNDLEKPFEEKELKEAIWRCGTNKSPGPDGFTVEFFKQHWEFLKNDLLEAYNEFADTAIIPKGVNAAFITLIPKVSNPMVVKEFKPISLISSIYKILSKMLANRLKKVLPCIIDSTQSAFIKNRQILDGPLITNEVLEWAKKKKRSCSCSNLTLLKLMTLFPRFT